MGGDLQTLAQFFLQIFEASITESEFTRLTLDSVWSRGIMVGQVATVPSQR